jgi:hypothetical protein
METLIVSTKTEECSSEGGNETYAETSPFAISEDFFLDR